MFPDELFDCFLVLMADRWLSILLRRSPVSPRFFKGHFTVGKIFCSCELVIGLVILSVLVLCSHRRHLASEQLLEPPFHNELPNLSLITLSFKFLGRLNATIDGSLKGLPFFC